MNASIRQIATNLNTNNYSVQTSTDRHLRYICSCMHLFTDKAYFNTERNVLTTRKLRKTKKGINLYQKNVTFPNTFCYHKLDA